MRHLLKWNTLLWVLQRWSSSLPYSFSLCFPCDVCNLISPWKTPVFSPWCVSTVWIGTKDSVASIRRAMQPSPRRWKVISLGLRKKALNSLCHVSHLHPCRQGQDYWRESALDHGKDCRISFTLPYTFVKDLDIPDTSRRLQGAELPWLIRKTWAGNCHVS